MQDRYVGDVGDFVKYGLLRAISEGKRLGVAWYLRTELGTAYLQQPEKWQQLDPDLFGVLRRLVDNRSRSVEAIEQSGLLGSATFASQPIDSRQRDSWFQRVRNQLSGCDLVFADPDKGLSLKKSSEHILVDEARTLAEGRIAVIYHHNGRTQRHIDEIQQWMNQLPGCTCAYWWKRFNHRTFFVINPDAETKRRIVEFDQDWKGHGEMVVRKI